MTPAAPTSQKRRFGLAPLAAALAALLVVIAGGAWWFLDANRLASVATTKPAEAARLSIVVLPFANLSGDPGQDYLADALTDELTTALARMRHTFVIARNTAMTFKGKPIDAKAIGKDLSVRFVLEGSVQPSGDRMRVNAQLIDAGSGAHLWAEQFDTPRADLLQMQDAIVTHLTRALDFQLTEVEAARLKRRPAANPNAEDLALQCTAGAWKAGWIGKEADAAYALCEQALAIDPDNVSALTIFGIKFFEQAALGVSGDPKGDLKRADELESAGPEEITTNALDLLAKATAINPGYAFAYYLRSLALFVAKRYADAVEAARMATKINPNLAFGYMGMGQAEWPLGMCEEAIAHVNEAFKISPRDPGVGLWYFNIANAEFCLGRYDAAVEDYKRAVATYRPFIPYVYWAAAAAKKGDDPEAKWALGEAKSRALDLTIKWFKAREPAPEFVVQSLRKAGLPEE